jgi:hypothetical protein
MYFYNKKCGAKNMGSLADSKLKNNIGTVSIGGRKDHTLFPF